MAVPGCCALPTTYFLADEGLEGYKSRSSSKGTLQLFNE